MIGGVGGGAKVELLVEWEGVPRWSYWWSGRGCQGGVIGGVGGGGKVG